MHAEHGKDAAQDEKLARELRAYDTLHSPFLELQTPFTAWEAAKMALLIWTVPLRLALGVGAMLVLACLSYAAAYGQDISKPLPPSRRRLVVAASKCARVIVFALDFRVKVTGFENYAKAREVGALGVFNHSAWLDSILLMWLFAPSGLSLASNAELPLVGTCIRAFQNIYVPRSSHGTAARLQPGSRGGAPTVSDLIARRVVDTRFPMLVAAPEGTCGDGRGVLHFRSGCFLPGAPVLPILFQYEKRCVNPAWTIVNEGWHFLRLMCQVSNAVEVTILPPYLPSAAERADARLFAGNVRRLFAEKLGLPLIDQSVAHYAALMRARVGVSLDGRTVVAPPGVLGPDGIADLTAAAEGAGGRAWPAAKQA